MRDPSVACLPSSCTRFHSQPRLSSIWDDSSMALLKTDEDSLSSMPMPAHWAPCPVKMNPIFAVGAARVFDTFCSPNASLSCVKSELTKAFLHLNCDLRQASV